MISRQHVENDFFEGAEQMRQVLDARFKDAYTDSISWYYFCDPKMYTYLRAAPWRIFPKPLFDTFMHRLRHWCIENLGLVPMNLPYLHLMVNGCRLGLHSDFHNGAWGYVYSLTRWDQRKFTGGETLLLRDGVPSYKKHHVHGEVLYELVPANFNQLLIFDDRIVHATPTIEGSMDPVEGRMAMVGHIRAASPEVSGSLASTDARRVIMEALPHLRERIRNYKDVQGTITFRIGVATTGAVESVAVLTNNVVTAATGYGSTDAVGSVRQLIQQMIAALKFPPTAGRSTIVVPILIPIPDLRPIEFSVAHAVPRETLHERAVTRLAADEVPPFKGSWDGNAFLVEEPVAGQIRIEAHEIAFSFDAPMWVPSQREGFQGLLRQWAERVSAKADAKES